MDGLVVEIPNDPHWSIDAEEIEAEVGTESVMYLRLNTPTRPITVLVDWLRPLAPMNYSFAIVQDDPDQLTRCQADRDIFEDWLCTKGFDRERYDISWLDELDESA
ncbi:hypothetical protein [Nocardia gipuzkoensis]